jgi:hypothetical protein
MRHSAAKLVVHLLSDNHKQNRLSVCKAPQDQVKKGINFFSKIIIVQAGENPAKGTMIRRYRRQISFPMDADVVGKEYVPYNGKLEDFCPIRAETSPHKQKSENLKTWSIQLSKRDQNYCSFVAREGRKLRV